MPQAAVPMSAMIHLADEQNELLTSLLAPAGSRLEPHVGTADLQRGKYWRNRSNRWFRCIFRIQALFPFWFRWRSSRANRLVAVAASLARYRRP
jgi:hypothetical protein